MPNLVTWPLMKQYPSRAEQATGVMTGNNPDRLELMQTNISLNYPQRIMHKSKYSNQWITYNNAAGEFAGSITIAEWNFHDAEFYALDAFLNEMMTDPTNNYCLIDWKRPSLFSLDGRWLHSKTANNQLIGNVRFISGNVWRIRRSPRVPLPPGEIAVPSVGEYFGFNKKTYQITEATFASGTVDQWDIKVAPNNILPSVRTGDMYKRHYFPAHFLPNQNITRNSVGEGRAGPFSINIVEAAVN